MGLEFWSKGTNIQEGPGVNIARIENNGRTFEYLSGEDPILGGTLVKPLVDGIQQHVMSITKHYMMNNQETDRSGGNEARAAISNFVRCAQSDTQLCVRCYNRYGSVCQQH